MNRSNGNVFQNGGGQPIFSCGKFILKKEIEWPGIRLEKTKNRIGEMKNVIKKREKKKTWLRPSQQLSLLSLGWRERKLDGLFIAVVLFYFLLKKHVRHARRDFSFPVLIVISIFDCLFFCVLVFCCCFVYGVFYGSHFCMVYSRIRLPPLEMYTEKQN